MTGGRNLGGRSDFLLSGGEIFASVVYAQLLLENARLYREQGIDDDLLDQIFDFQIGRAHV